MRGASQNVRKYSQENEIFTGFHKRFLKIVNFDFIKSWNFPKINHWRHQRGSKCASPLAAPMIYFWKGSTLSKWKICRKMMLFPKARFLATILPKIVKNSTFILNFYQTFQSFVKISQHFAFLAKTCEKLTNIF